MKRTSCFFWAVIFSLSVFGQEQRALLIGINHYLPPPDYQPSTSEGRMNVEDLHGCINDANAIYSIITSKFGFGQKNVDTLLDDSATRDGILNAMNKLLEKSNAGDIVFIYYAGHGSEVRNSLSFEADKKDQTIVPANFWKEGIRDIRDKELSKIFNDFLDKKVKLTVIFDCCHSGSISRGPNVRPEGLRYMPMENWDSKDPARYPIPETRPDDDFLIFSAAQSDEIAAECVDDNQVHHGAFTRALIEALDQQSVDASAIDIFTSARAILKSLGKSQEPVIGGSAKREQETLFGIKQGKLSDYSFVAVSGIIGDKVQVQAGFALGLAKENELAMFNDDKDTIFKLRIDIVLGVTKSLASVVKGDIHNIKPGYQFRVTNWVSSGRPLIKLYIPKSGLSDADVSKFTGVAKQLKSSRKIKWVPFIGKGEKDPYATVFWINDKCFLKIDTGAAIEIKNITAPNILKFCKKDSTLYVELPLSKQNADKYYSRLMQNKSLELVDSINDANYTLFGRLGMNGLPAYGFRKTQVSAGDSLESMPIETDCFELAAQKGSNTRNVADSLFDIAMKLSKLRGWLTLTGPESTKKGFVYHLEFFNEDKKQMITDGHYRIGDKISIKLVLDPDYRSNLTGLKYVYIFGVDQSGSMVLYYPDDDGNVSNRYPKFNNDNIVKEVPIITDETIPEPSGTDNYFLLASDEAIPNATSVFNQEGVYSGETSREIKKDPGPLYDLLNMGNGGTRLPPKLPATWSFQRLSFHCTH